MPIFRMFSRGNSLGTFLAPVVFVLVDLVPVFIGVLLVLPPVMGESAVGLGHPVGIFSFLDSISLALECFGQFFG
jgi:hypothetical protein